MDEKEAIKIIKECGYIGNEVGVAFDVAIKALEEVDKLKAEIDRLTAENQQWEESMNKAKIYMYDLETNIKRAN